MNAAEITNRVVVRGSSEMHIQLADQHELALALVYSIILYVITTISQTPRKQFKFLTPYQAFTGYNFIWRSSIWCRFCCESSSKVEARSLGIDLDKFTPSRLPETSLVCCGYYPVIVSTNE